MRELYTEVYGLLGRDGIFVNPEYVRSPRLNLLLFLAGRRKTLKHNFKHDTATFLARHNDRAHWLAFRSRLYSRGRDVEEPKRGLLLRSEG